MTTKGNTPDENYEVTNSEVEEDRQITSSHDADKDGTSGITRNTVNTINGRRNEGSERQEQEQQQQQHDDDDDEKKKIDKAVKFWCHPMLQNVPPDEKHAYLRERGISDRILHKAWDRMVATSDDNDDDKLETYDNQKEQPTTKARHNGGVESSIDARQQQQQHLHGQSQQIKNSIDHWNSSHGSMGNNNGIAMMTPKYGYENHSGGGHYPHHSPHHVYPYGNEYVEDDGATGQISLTHGLSLLAVGGMIGLTAAAAIRWLNGGDFELFPPILDTENIHHQQLDGESALDKQNEGINHADGAPRARGQPQTSGSDCGINVDDENEYDGDYIHNDQQDDVVVLLHEELIERIEKLTENVQANTSMQETILKKVTLSSSAFADQSISLLRRASDSSATGGVGETKRPGENAMSSLDVSWLLLELTEIKADLSRLSERISLDTTNNESEDDEIQQGSTKILSALEACIDKVRNTVKPEPKNVDRANRTSSPAMSTSTTTPSDDDEEHSSSAPKLTSSSPQERSFANDNNALHDHPEGEMMSLHDCIRSTAKNDIVTMRVGCQLLYLYLVNLAGSPENPRYRTIYTSNESFQKVACLSGGRDLLKAVGFLDDKDSGVMHWLPSAMGHDEMTALAHVKEAAAALSILKSGKPSAETTALALSKLTPETKKGGGEEEGNTYDGSCGTRRAHESRQSNDDSHNAVATPQTPIGSSIVSPPLPKKLSYVALSGTPTNLAERLKNSEE